MYCNGFKIKINFFKYKRFKDGSCAYQNTRSSHGQLKWNDRKLLIFPAISINENQSLIAINIINNNPLIIIDWFNQSIKIDTHSPNGLNCYWLLLIFIDNWLRNFIARGSVDLRHKSRAYCVSTITRLHSFPCFDQSHGIVTKHLFPDFTCSRPTLVFEMAKQVELSIRCVFKGYHECPFEVNIGEESYAFKKRGERGNAFKVTWLSME